MGTGTGRARLGRERKAGKNRPRTFGRDKAMLWTMTALSWGLMSHLFGEGEEFLGNSPHHISSELSSRTEP